MLKHQFQNPFRSISERGFLPVWIIVVVVIAVVTPFLFISRPAAPPQASEPPTASPEASLSPTVMPSPLPSEAPGAKEGTPSPRIEVSPSPSATPTPSPKTTPKPSPKPTKTPSPTVVPSQTPVATSTPEPTPEPTPIPTPTPTPTPSPTPEPVAQVTFDGIAKKFVPSDLTVLVGSSVRFRNDATFQSIQIASNPHPAHTDHPEFVSGILAPGESFIFTFNVLGDWEYHNHLNASAVGVIHVRTSF